MNTRLKNQKFDVSVSSIGASILNAYFEGNAFLRETKSSGNFNILATANFPMIPFANRVENNTFRVSDTTYKLSPNTDFDPLYLHGDTWFLTWELISHTEREATREIIHNSKEGEPYSYLARQHIKITDKHLEIKIYLENLGFTLPFGVGHHFYFPLTEHTTLCAKHKTFWTEKQGFLPDKEISPPPHLDFNSPNTLPDQWINNGYEDWDARAKIIWQEYNLGLDIQADNNFGRFLLFRSSVDFEPSFNKDYFCFEPMTHTANAHNLTGDYGLITLSKGECMEAEIKLKPYSIR